MVYLLTLLALSVSSFLGFLLLRLMDGGKKTGVLERLGLSYGMGLGAIAVIMTFLSLAGISFNVFNILAPFILIVASGVVLKKAFQKPGVEKSKNGHGYSKMNRAELFFFGAILFEVCFAFFVSLVKPMESWDAVAHWGAKAKIMYLLKGLPLDIFSKPGIKDATFTGDYPWLWPFVQNYIHNFIGRFNDFAPKMAGPFFFASCLVVFYGVLRNVRSTRLHALIFTFFLASIPHFNAYASNGYADLILSFYYSVGFIYLYLWFRDKDRAHLIISVIFTAMACYVKCEGLLLALVTILTFLSFILFSERGSKARAFRSFIFYIVTLAVLSLPMFLLKHATASNIANQAMSVKLLSDFKVENFHRILPIIYDYQKQFFGIKAWNLVWVLFIISVFLGFKRGVLFGKDVRFLTIALGLVFLAHVSFFMISGDVTIYLRALNRMLLHFLPLVVFFIARVFAPELDIYEQEKR